MTREYYRRDAKLFEYATLKATCQGIPTPIDQWLCQVTYANGARVQETCDLEYKDFEWTDDFLYIHSPILKKRGNTIPKRANPIDRKQEPWLTEPIIKYIEKNRSNPMDTNKVWSYSTRTAQRRFDLYFDAISHSMRHNRATHLITIFHFRVEEIGVFFGLSPSGLYEWWTRYGHLGRTYLEEKLMAQRRSD